MILFTTVTELKNHLKNERKNGRTVGFTPTMGALHEGHLSLLKKSESESDINVCSIFVNPTQFNEQSDLDKYPKTLEKDLELISEIKNAVVFWPSVNELYPPGLNTKLNIDFEGLDKVMEGEFRPGHFAGVAQVVNRLLDIVEPDTLYMGQKDYQQVAIVRKMLKAVGKKVRLVPCPTIRESDGLAKSSRNRRLTPEIRKKANVINRTLNWAKEQVGHKTVAEVQRVALENLSIDGFRPEYFDIVDGHTLKSIENWNDSNLIIACTAVWGGEVRLIDNVVLRHLATAR